jgi:hypothetical protein
MLLDQLLNVRLVIGQLWNKFDNFYLSTDDEYKVWEGDQPLVMDNSETNVIIFIYPRVMSIEYGRAISRLLWTTPKQMV